MVEQAAQHVGSYSSNSNEPSGPVNGDIVILEETTPIKIDMFHYMIKGDHSEELVSKTMASDFL